MKPGLCPVYSMVGSAQAPRGGEGGQPREERRLGQRPRWQPAARLSTAPFVLLLVVESLAPVPRGVRQPVSRPGDCLHERWRLEQNQPFLFQGDEWHLESSPPPPPTPSVCVALHTRQGHRSPSSCALSSNDRTTHCPDHPGGPPQPSQAEGRKRQAVGRCEVLPPLRLRPRFLHMG